MKKTLMLGKIEDKGRREWQRIRLLDRIAESMNMNLSKLWEIVESRGDCMLESMGLQRVRLDLATELKQS